MLSSSQFLEQHFSLKNKLAVVTGGTGVLGREMARALAGAGAHVVILARRKKTAEELILKFKEEFGTQGLAVETDVTDQSSLEKAAKEIESKFGVIDILVNAAGGNLPGAVIQPNQSFFDLHLSDYQKVFDLNLTGTVLPTLILCKPWEKTKKGVIINISSMAAQRALTRVMGYSLAKAAVDNFTKWLSVEMATKYGEAIRVNAIAPGFFLTQQNKKLLTNDDGSLTERGQKIIAQTPMKRFGNADELAGTLIWLCSDASKFVTGTVVSVDGGFGAYSGV
ncbi:MAG TPA: D-mannonate oxidoreductase [Cytophagales bacterium]|jgi:NAD(P)-dependent dehydrogenase (short-subunit alcohol dehydrogenase family)|nr:D-mannonate oxidoreductase [Cytophagales bacterium]